METGWWLEEVCLETAKVTDISRNPISFVISGNTACASETC